MQAAAVEITQCTYTAPANDCRAVAGHLGAGHYLGSVKPLTVLNLLQNIMEPPQARYGGNQLEALDAPTIQKLYTV